MSNVETMTAELIDLMSVPKRWDAGKRWRVAMARVAGLGLADTCRRCGGGGHHSYCVMHGTTCFDCGGCGKVAPRVTAKLMDSVRAKVASGEFAAYMADLKKRAEIKREADAAQQGVLTAWGDLKLDAHYDWRLAADGVPYHREVADRVNRPIFDAFQIVSKYHDEADGFKYDYLRSQIKGDDAAAQVAALDADFIVRRQALLAQAQRARAIIAECAALLPEIKAKYAAEAVVV